MRTSTKNPADMSGEERIAEIATILARGLFMLPEFTWPRSGRQHYIWPDKLGYLSD